MEHLSKDEEILKRTQKRVKDLKGFYDHLIVFIIIHIMILGAVLYFNGSLKFFITFTLLGWGIGLLVHALIVFKWNPITTKKWEQQKIEEFLKEDENNYHE
ncbi:2TM domain-containing protein [Nonlabens sp.]|uniref:2TM domain-containing protein n=1 Tax=Nonlabens sp. TaxID=1888209 RepID=UPI003F69E6FA